MLTKSSVVALSASALLAASSVKALEVTFPNGNGDGYWVACQPQTLRWTSSSSDPSIFSVALLNVNQQDLNGNYQIANSIPTANGEATIFVNCVATGQYNVLLVNASQYSLNNPEVYTKSATFQLNPNGTAYAAGNGNGASGTSGTSGNGNGNGNGDAANNNNGGNGDGNGNGDSAGNGGNTAGAADTAGATGDSNGADANANGNGNGDGTSGAAGAAGTAAAGAAGAAAGAAAAGASGAASGVSGAAASATSGAVAAASAASSGASSAASAASTTGAAAAANRNGAAGLYAPTIVLPVVGTVLSAAFGMFLL